MTTGARIYTPNDWFWIVAGDESRAWSSAVGAYVEQFDEQRLTRIDSEESLTDVLRVYGLPGPVVAEADYATAIQSHIDTTAQSRCYDSGVSLATYTTSSIPTYAAEATAFVSWRDAVWAYAYGELAKVQNGQRPKPTVSEMIAELPEIEWPV